MEVDNIINEFIGYYFERNYMFNQPINIQTVVALQFLLEGQKTKKGLILYSRISALCLNSTSSLM